MRFSAPRKQRGSSHLLKEASLSRGGSFPESTTTSKWGVSLFLYSLVRPPWHGVERPDNEGEAPACPHLVCLPGVTLNLINSEGAWHELPGRS